MSKQKVETYKVISRNVKGLNRPEKKTILRELESQKPQISFIQETHFKENRILKFGNLRYPNTYHHGSDNSISKGVTVVY